MQLSINKTAQKIVFAPSIFLFFLFSLLLNTQSLVSKNGLRFQIHQIFHQLLTYSLAICLQE